MTIIRQQQRRGPASDWVAQNPILLAGEMGLESDTTFFKFGDGVTPWNSLPYSSMRYKQISLAAYNALATKTPGVLYILTP